MSVASLIENAIIPPIYRIQQTFTDDGIRDIDAAVRETMDASGLCDSLPRNGEIAVAVGSRGIAGLPEMVRAVVAWFKDKGSMPYIVPSV